MFWAGTMGRELDAPLGFLKVWKWSQNSMWTFWLNTFFHSTKRRTDLSVIKSSSCMTMQHLMAHWLMVHLKQKISEGGKQVTSKQQLWKAFLTSCKKIPAEIPQKLTSLMYVNLIVKLMSNKRSCVKLESCWDVFGWKLWISLNMILHI